MCFWTKMLKLTIAYSLLVIAMAVFNAGTANAKNDGISDAANIIRKLDPKNLSRRWYGGETFCIFGKNTEPRSTHKIRDLIAAINETFGSDFKVLNETDYSECPSFATFYVMVGHPIEIDELAAILKGLSGSQPPKTIMQELVGLRGFVINLPGNRRREFIYLDQSVQATRSNSDPFTSILVEEVFHALTGLGDFFSDKIVSVLGKNPHVDNYFVWFEKNPRGLCVADLYLLEMHIGHHLKHLDHQVSALAWLKSHSEELKELRPILFAALEDYLDSRCQ